MFCREVLTLIKPLILVADDALHLTIKSLRCTKDRLSAASLKIHEEPPDRCMKVGELEL
jgi:hypothetical protein